MEQLPSVTFLVPQGCSWGVLFLYWLPNTFSLVLNSVVKRTLLITVLSVLSHNITTTDQYATQKWMLTSAVTVVSSSEYVYDIGQIYALHCTALVKVILAVAKKATPPTHTHTHTHTTHTHTHARTHKF